MTDLEYFKLSKPERFLRGLGKGIVSIPSRIGGGLKNTQAVKFLVQPGSASASASASDPGSASASASA